MNLFLGVDRMFDEQEMPALSCDLMEVQDVDSVFHLYQGGGNPRAQAPPACRQVLQKQKELFAQAEAQRGCPVWGSPSFFPFPTVLEPVGQFVYNNLASLINGVFVHGRFLA